MILTLLSAIFGGLLRLAPEVFKMLDAKDDRAHELAMVQKQIEMQQLTGQQKIGDVQAQGAITIEESALQAIAALNTAQATMAVAAGPLAAFISSLVRPLVTYFVVGLWGAYKVSLMVFSYHATGSATETLMNSWGENDAQMLSMILAFWFVGRSIERNNGQIR